MRFLFPQFEFINKTYGKYFTILKKSKKDHFKNKDAVVYLIPDLIAMKCRNIKFIFQLHLLHNLKHYVFT